MTRTISDLNAIGKALEEYKAESGFFPNTEKGLRALVPKYLLHVPEDVWGEPYKYKLENSHYILWSLGSDGVIGGNGLAHDFSSSTPLLNERVRDEIYSKDRNNLRLIIVVVVLLVLSALGFLVVLGRAVYFEFLKKSGE